jgi:SRSO17 transposase
VLAIDEHGDRKDGDHTAHVSRQYLSNLGKIDNGVVKVEQPVGRCAGLLSG